MKYNKTSDICSHTDFTVLMPTHNSENMHLQFERAIKSIYANTLLPQRTLVIVDGVLNQTFEQIVLRLQRLYNYDCIWLPTNMGITKALNIGLASVDTRWTIRADSDDINLPYRFEALISKLKEGYDVVGSWVIEIDEQGVPLCTKRVPEDHNDILRLCRYRNPMNHMSTAFNTNKVWSAGGYPEIYKREDYGLWALLIRHGALFANIPDPLVLASAGNTQYERRSGLRYIKGELDLQVHLVKHDVSDWCSAIIIGAARSAVFAMPKLIHRVIYRHFLRSKIIS